MDEKRRDNTLDGVAFRLAWLDMKDRERSMHMQALAKEQGDADRERDELIRRMDRYFRTHPDVGGLHMTAYDAFGCVRHYAILPDGIDGVTVVPLHEAWREDGMILAEESSQEVGSTGVYPVDDEGTIVLRAASWAEQDVTP